MDGHLVPAISNSKIRCSPENLHSTRNAGLLFSTGVYGRVMGDDAAHAAAIDVRDSPAHEAGLMKAATQWYADVAGFQAAPRYLGEHGSKQERVGIAHQRDGGGAAEFFFEIFRSLHSSKSADKYDDTSQVGGGR